MLFSKDEITGQIKAALLKDGTLRPESVSLSHALTRSVPADPDSLDVEFDYEKVEQEGDLFGYNEILPYGDMMQVTLNDVDHVILDMYCVIPKCPGTTHKNGKGRWQK